MASVPGFGVINKAREFSTVAGFLGGTIGGVFLAILLLPIRLAQGLAEGLFTFGNDVLVFGTRFIVAPLAGGETVIIAGAEVTAGELPTFGIGAFPVAVGGAFLTVAGAVIIADLAGFDVPFVGDVLPGPYGAEDDEGEDF